MLHRVAEKCNSDTLAYLKIFGYTDTLGSEKYNEILSRERAFTVCKYLTSVVKIYTTKVYITWLGESNEAYDLHFDDAHVQQKCVDLLISFRKKPD